VFLQRQKVRISTSLHRREKSQKWSDVQNQHELNGQNQHALNGQNQHEFAPQREEPKNSAWSHDAICPKQGSSRGLGYSRLCLEVHGLITKLLELPTCS
jgi:hypothetical protein